MHVNPGIMLGTEWVVTAVFWLLTAFSQKRAVLKENNSHAARHGALALIAFTLLFSRRLSLGLLGEPVLPAMKSAAWIGFAIANVGFIVTFWARIVLGGEWSSQVALKVGHRLIQVGPYRLVRHPIYSGLLFAMLGTAITGNQVRMYLALPFAFAAFWYKLRLEETLLMHAMGDRYRVYREHTRALIPGLL